MRNKKEVHKPESKIESITQAVANLDDITKKNIAFKIRTDFIANAPRNASELYQATEVLFGKSIPFTACSEETVAPFKLVHDIFFDKIPAGKGLALANRGGSKTYYGSMSTYMSCTYKPGYQARHAGANRQQARVAASYLADFSNDKVLASQFMAKPNKYDATWSNNSQWVIVTGSTEGVSGQHIPLFTMDEIEFWDVDALEQTWAVPVPYKDYPATWLAYSTRQKASSAMSWLVENASARNVTVYQWTIFETMQRCNSCLCISGGRVRPDPSSHCLLWERCQGIKGRKSSGWVPRETVIELCKSLGGPDSNAAKTQLFCEKSSTHGLVMHNFVHEYANNGGNLSRWTYNSKLPYVIWYDPSEGKKAVMFFVQVLDKKMRVFDQLILGNCSGSSEAKRELLTFLQMRGYADPAMIVVDPRRVEVVADLRTPDVCGYSFKATTAPLNESAGGNLVRLGCEAVRTAICNGSGERHLLVNPEMAPGFIEMIKHFSYPVGTDGQIKSENPLPFMKDEFDAVHYGVDWMVDEGMNAFGLGGNLIMAI